MAGLHPGGRSLSKGPAKFASFGCEMHGAIMTVRADDWTAHIGTSYHLNYNGVVEGHETLKAQYSTAL